MAVKKSTYKTYIHAYIHTYRHTYTDRDSQADRQTHHNSRTHTHTRTRTHTQSCMCNRNSSWQPKEITCLYETVALFISLVSFCCCLFFVWLVGFSLFLFCVVFSCGCCFFLFSFPVSYNSKHLMVHRVMHMYIYSFLPHSFILLFEWSCISCSSRCTCVEIYFQLKDFDSVPSEQGESVKFVSFEFAIRTLFLISHLENVTYGVSVCVCVCVCVCV